MNYKTLNIGEGLVYDEVTGRLKSAVPEGPVGPAGPTGATGPQGANSRTGGQSVSTSSHYNIDLNFHKSQPNI